MKKNEALPEKVKETESGAKKSARKTVTRTIIPAILCVLGAFALWLYVMQTESPTYTETVAGIEVKLEGIDELAEKTGLSVYSGEGTTVNVVVSGKKSLIARLSSGDVGATVDVSRIAAAGRHALPVVIDLPSGLTLTDTVPNSVTVYADETVSKTVPVREKLTHLELPADYKQGQIEFGFDTVTVEGPAGKVNGITEAQVVIDMADKTSSFSAIYPITFTDSLGAAVTMDYLKCSATEIDVSVPIYLTAELTVPYKFRYGLLPEDSVTVTLTPSVLTVTGDEKDVVSDSAISAVVIDEKAITSNSYSFTVTPEISSKLTLESGAGEIEVNVEIASSLITKTFTVKDIRVTGTSSECEPVDESVSVTLRGTKEQLEAVGDGDVYVTVDMTGYDDGSAGVVTRPAAVVVEAEGAESVFEVGSYSVQVKIS
ncbi:MAG: hypothetical protein IJK58_01560 [Clostridia bacterium]|nr:hypothetical protein [Clostridia bacterium]